MRRLPADCTRTALADAAALRAIVHARRNARVLTRTLLEESMQEVFHSPRYSDMPHPALRTVVASAKRQAKHDRDLTVRLSTRDIENRIRPS